jgi:hypothetical protein
VIAPSLAFASGSVVTVKGTNYAIGSQPSFVVTGSAGSTVALFLSGTGVIGTKMIGNVMDQNGTLVFRLPAGLKKGTYHIQAQSDGLSSGLLSFKIGPAPHIKTPPKPRGRSKAPSPHTASKKPSKTVIRVQHHAVGAHQVQTASVSNGHVIDQAVHSLVQNPLPFKNNKKKGH